MTNELVNKNMANLPAVPDYMKVEGDKSIEGLKQYIRPSRIKVVQKLSDQKLLETFGIGSVILVPDNIMIMEMPYEGRTANPGMAVPFLFTPIFFFSEFCCWNPLEKKGTLPAIRERSLDQNSRVARMARDFNARVQPFPDDPKLHITFCEHLNFIVHIYGQKEPCVLTFSRGEFKAGTNFATMIKLRGVPLYGNIFAANLAYRENAKGNWYGLDISNPPNADDSPYVGEENFRFFKALHEEFAEKASLIEVNYEDDAIDATVSPAADSI